MKKSVLFGAAVAALLFALSIPWLAPLAQETASQVTLTMAFLKQGVLTDASSRGVLQIGQLSTLSAAVASATRTEVVAAPAAGNAVYVRGLFVQSSTTGTGSITVSYGTGTNCATGTTTVLTLTAATGQTLPFGYANVGAKIPAANALCLQTDAATTSVRALTN